MENGPGIGDVPIKNYTLSRWKGTKKLTPSKLQERELKKHACFNCPVACTKTLEYDGAWTRAPEYETLAMLGANVQVDDLEKIIEWNVLANDLGLDTISLGATISCFLETIQEELIDIDPTKFGIKKIQDEEKGDYWDVWGCDEAISTLIPMIAARDGIGDQLADGVKRFIETNSLPEDMDTTGKGLEMPAHEPRGNNLAALDYATTPRGAFHCYMPMLLSSNMNLKNDIGLSSLVDRFGKDETIVDAVIKIQDAATVFDACGGCIFGFQTLSEVQPWVDAVNAVKGANLDIDSWMEAGSRIFNLKRKYNEKLGITKEDDTLGKRFFNKIKKGGTKKNIPPLEEILPMYYQKRGWN